ncbi:hypothetical protein LTS18_011884 [Coniosporium uncinatum]|uniref:Uncharacterized protein n=1 Tax=Coniosporium uncinatum TaxID=93489 RepID=A0ACC3DCR1_9PEZI|nr:hypothetical protein LTS18_011884 [Coniosporium uncinatum]
MASAHRNKRPFQPQITSFFTQTDHDAYLSTAAASSPASQPILPSQIQASLINVGMRVRKSVAEGYKTHKTQPLITSYSDNQQLPTFGAARSKELAPFCGLHRTGGLAAQASLFPHSSAPGAVNAHVNMFQFGAPVSQASSFPNISQTSMESMPARPPSNPNKRSFDASDDEEDEQLDNMLLANFDDGIDPAFPVDVQISPKTTFPKQRNIPDFCGLGAPRLDNRPKARLKRKVGNTGRMLVREMSNVEEDFEEAAFLTPMDVDDV